MSTTITQQLSEIPTPPSRSDPTNFDEQADSFLGAFPGLRTELNSIVDQMNAAINQINILYGIIDEVETARKGQASLLAEIESLESQYLHHTHVNLSGVAAAQTSSANTVPISGSDKRLDTDWILEAMMAGHAALSAIGTVAQDARLVRDVYAQEGVVTFAAASDQDFRTDFASVSLDASLPHAEYVVVCMTSDPAGMGEAVVYDRAVNGFKLRVTGSGGGDVVWKLYALSAR
jgi:hypothetical protein